MVRSAADRAGEAGSAPIESLFAITLLLLLALGVIEVAFALYGRNVVMSSAHEGARAGIELRRGVDEAQAVARDVVRRSAGGLVRDLDVDAQLAEEPERAVLVVRVSGVVSAWGPVPLPIPISVRATASRELTP